MLLIQVEIIQSYLEAHFGSHQFIIIASFTDIHKNYEGFSKGQMDQKAFQVYNFLFKSHGSKIRGVCVGFPLYLHLGLQLQPFLQTLLLNKHKNTRGTLIKEWILS